MREGCGFSWQLTDQMNRARLRSNEVHITSRTHILTMLTMCIILDNKGTSLYSRPRPHHIHSLSPSHASMITTRVPRFKRLNSSDTSQIDHHKSSNRPRRTHPRTRELTLYASPPCRCAQIRMLNTHIQRLPLHRRNHSLIRSRNNIFERARRLYQTRLPTASIIRPVELLAIRHKRRTGTTYVPYFAPTAPHDATAITYTHTGKQEELAVPFLFAATKCYGGVITAGLLDIVCEQSGTAKVGMAVMPVAHSIHVL